MPPPTEVMRLLAEAHEIFAEDIRINRTLGSHGAELLRDGARVLTHCNAGALATAGHGTALGIIRSAVEAGKKISVIDPVNFVVNVYFILRSSKLCKYHFRHFYLIVHNSFLQFGVMRYFQFRHYYLLPFSTFL